MKFSMLLSSFAVWAMGHGSIVSTHNDILTCGKVSENLAAQLNYAKNIRSSKGQPLSLSEYVNFFGTYSDHMATCQSYWQKEKVHFKEMLSFFQEDLEKITPPIHSIEIEEKEETFDNQTMHYNDSADAFVQEEETNTQKPIPKEIKDAWTRLYTIHFNIAMISSFEGYDKQGIRSMQHAADSAAFISLDSLNKLRGKAYNQLGNIYYKISDYNNALEAHALALIIFENIERTEEVKEAIIHTLDFRARNYLCLWRLGDWIMTIQAKERAYKKLYGADDYRARKFSFFFRTAIFFLDTAWNSLLCCMNIFIAKKMMQYAFYIYNRYFVRSEH